MKVFISWSGRKSQKVALLLKNWLGCVIQASKPWVSSEDIERGSIWFNEINEILNDVSLGIVCLTESNKNKPWILFEAGALTTGLNSSRVCTFLIDLKSNDVTTPLSQFNHTLPNKDSMFKLIKTINSELKENKLDIEILKGSFDVNWEKFEKEFTQILDESFNEDTSNNLNKRSNEDFVSEILTLSRSLDNRLQKIENMIKFDDQIEDGVMKEYKILIANYLNDGLNDSEIISKLIEYDLSESKIIELIKIVKKNKKKNLETGEFSY